MIAGAARTPFAETAITIPGSLNRALIFSNRVPDRAAFVMSTYESQRSFAASLSTRSATRALPT